MPAAAATKPQDTVRRKLARTLIDLRLRHKRLFDEIDGLKTSLVLNAENAGDGFREVFDKKGIITVAAPKDAVCRGNLPAIDVAAFNALSEARRQKLIEDGIVKIAEDWSRKFYGRVDVKLFGP